MLQIPEFTLLTKKMYNEIRAEREQRRLAVKQWWRAADVGEARGTGTMGFTW